MFPHLFPLKLAVGVEVALIAMRWAVRGWSPGRINFILRRSLCGAGTGYALVCLENLNVRLLTLLIMMEL